MPFYWPTFLSKSPVWALFTRFFNLPPVHNWRRHCSKIIIFSAGLVFVLSLVQSLTPPWDYDGLMYHLQGPVTFLEEESIKFSLNNWQINNPFTLEMLFTFGLAFNSDSFAKLIHLTYTICLYAVTFFMADRLINRRVAWIALAVMLGIPPCPFGEHGHISIRGGHYMNF